MDLPELSALTQPMTWVDIARRIKTLDPQDELWRSRPDKLLRVDIYWNGVTLLLSPGPTTETEALDWLDRVFPGRLDKERLDLRLEAPDGMNRLPVLLEALDSPLEMVGDRPSSSVEPRILLHHPRQADSRDDQSELPVFACHSVKGGVGRTTTAVALALELARRPAYGPVLLVDADFEAPGISFLLRRRVAEFAISLEDVIALVHADAERYGEKSIAFAADRLRDHRADDLVILPVRRALDDLVGSAVRPEHLTVTEGGTGFVLTSVLRRLAFSCGCKSVVIDLRAGLVPVAAEVLLDPEVGRVIVTTLSGQARDATIGMFKFLGREFRRMGVEPIAPLVLFNRVPTLFENLGVAAQLRNTVLDAATEALIARNVVEATADEPLDLKATDIEAIFQVSVPEISDLAVTAEGWDEFVSQIRRSEFPQRLSEAIDGWLYDSFAIATVPANLRVGDGLLGTEALHVSRNDQRQRLADFSGRYIFAETPAEELPAPLVTAPMAALAEGSVSRLPVVVSEGAKGTGKTLTFRFLFGLENWKTVVCRLAKRGDAIAAALLPVWGSREGTLSEQMLTARERVARGLSLGSPISLDDLKDQLLRNFRTSEDDADRASLWLDAIAWSSGFEPGASGVGRRFLDYLRTTNNHVVALVEGLEELLRGLPPASTEPITRSLLIDVAQRLRDEPGRPLGLVIFARSDSVEGAIRQNLGQFRAANRPYALNWTEADVLELVAWLVHQSGAIPGLWTEEFSKASREERIDKLDCVWGRKLGPDEAEGKRVREARTAEWVIAVLSDLNGRLTARDLVRFVQAAAQGSVDLDQPGAAERLLIPQALRKAVGPTSREKVSEIQTEIPELVEIFKKFETETDIRTPLDRDSVERLHLTPEDLEQLRRHGVLFGDQPPYEVPELFRMGLGLKRSGARPNIINILRRARERSGVN